MIKHCAYVIVAMGSLSLNGAFGQVTGVTLEENDTGRTGRETLPMPAVIKTPGSAKGVGEVLQRIDRAGDQNKVHSAACKLFCKGRT